MKTALIQYWLTKSGGAEKVLSALGEMYPDADLFTHAFGEGMRDGGLGIRWHGHEVRESLIARLPLGRAHPQAYLPLMPLASRRLDLSAYDLIISSEAGPIKGVRKRADQRHVCYCHSPMRYIWDLRDEYYRNAGLGGKIAMGLFTGYLRREDLRSAESVDLFVANSRFVAGRIRRIYGREAEVAYPPCDIGFFSAPIDQSANRPVEQSPCYLAAGRMVGYKRMDLAVSACLRMGRPLTVIGVGEQESRLRRLSEGSPLIRFLGRVDDIALRRAYRESSAVLFPGLEDFGIVPVEAQAAGTPVIAYGAGGVLETVADGRTGLFFHEQTVESLCAAIEEFEGRTWDSGLCKAHVVRFSADAFKASMRNLI